MTPEEMISIPKWKMVRIEDTLRLAFNIHHSHTKETCFDRCVCKAYDFAKEALGKKETSLDEYDISLRAIGILNACGFYTIESLRGKTSEDLLTFKQMTKKTIEELIDLKLITK